MKKILLTTSFIAALLILALPAMANDEAIRLEVVSVAKETLTLDLTINAFPDTKKLPSRTLEPGGKIIYTKSETAHTKTSGEFKFLGWQLKFAGNCTHEFTYKNKQCGATSSICGRSKVETIGPCAFRVTIGDN